MPAKKRLCGLLLLLFCPVMILPISCSTQSNTTAQHSTTNRDTQAKGEYIVTLKQGSEEQILKQIFHIYAIKKISDLGRNRYLIAFDPDPGFDQVKVTANKSNRVVGVQPNYIYHLNPPRKEIYR